MEPRRRIARQQRSSRHRRSNFSSISSHESRAVDEQLPSIVWPWGVTGRYVTVSHGLASTRLPLRRTPCSTRATKECASVPHRMDARRAGQRQTCDRPDQRAKPRARGEAPHRHRDSREWARFASRSVKVVKLRVEAETWDPERGEIAFSEARPN